MHHLIHLMLISFLLTAENGQGSGRGGVFGGLLDVSEMNEMNEMKIRL